MLALLTPLVKTTKLEISGKSLHCYPWRIQHEVRGPMKDLAKKNKLQKHIQEVKVLRRNQEEIHEDQPPTFSKSFFPSSPSLPSTLRLHGG